MPCKMKVLYNTIGQEHYRTVINTQKHMQWVPVSYFLAAISMRASVVKLFGLSMGSPRARSHTSELSTPSARDTPNRTV